MRSSDEYEQASVNGWRAAEVCCAEAIRNATEHLTDQAEITRIRGEIVTAQLQKWRQPST